MNPLLRDPRGFPWVRWASQTLPPAAFAGLMILLGLTLRVSGPASALNDCKDSPFAAGTVPGSTLHRCESEPMRILRVPVAEGLGVGGTARAVRGSYVHQEFDAPFGVGEDEIFRETASTLEEAGLSIVYQHPPELLTARRGQTWYLLENNGSYYGQTIVTEAGPGDSKE